MSEYQYVAFRAIEAPVSKANLRYMRQQSTRAEITPWSFDNEYHFGDFSGHALEMLRRGYDIHLHYCNFGVMKLMLRLPQGFPHPKAAKPYLDAEGIEYRKDKSGQGGILVIDPSYEPFESYFDDPWEKVLERLAPLREEIITGDLRPLYIANLAARTDDYHDPAEEIEPPVPAGLKQPAAAQRELASLYQMDKEVIAASAAESLPVSSTPPSTAPQQWLAQQPSEKKDQWLARCWEGEGGEVRRELIALFRDAQSPPPWATSPGRRAIAAILDEAEVLRDKANRKRNAAAEARRTKEDLAMASDPGKVLKQVDKLVMQQTTSAYAEASQLLYRLKEILQAKGQARLATEHAERLRERHPTRTRLVSELRRQGFIARPSRKLSPRRSRP